MALMLDPEIAAVFAALAEKGPAPVPPARGDWETLRENSNLFLEECCRTFPAHQNVDRKTFWLVTPDGVEIEMRWYQRQGKAPGSAIVHAHGGGMVAGNLEIGEPIVAGYVGETGVPLLTVGYRLAPEVRGSVPAEDVFSALVWLCEHAKEMEVDLTRIAVMGESAGGGIVAGAAILARDHGIELARQILIYPMLDDRNMTPDPQLVPFATWTYDNNFTGWNALLGEQFGGETVSPVAAPARLTALQGLAPAYIDVGDLDIFRDENILYALRLAQAGVSTELHVYPGAPHAFEVLAPNSRLAERAMSNRKKALLSL